MNTKAKKIILYVDDDPDDREFLSDALKHADPEVEVQLAKNGIEALEYLDESTSTKPPCLIVLDLNMPLLDGKETFKKIKDDKRLQGIPLIIFSSSERPTDKALFNELGVQYFSKPTNFSYLNSIADHMLKVCCQ